MKLGKILPAKLGLFLKLHSSVVFNLSLHFSTDFVPFVTNL